jgi:hypothetical protein
LIPDPGCNCIKSPSCPVAVVTVWAVDRFDCHELRLSIS